MDLSKTALGIEFGSTRIKAVLIDAKNAPIASGSYAWENGYVNGIWTYSMDDVLLGMQSCYAALAKDVSEKYGVPLTTVGAMGISGMMHGYLPFDRAGRQLAEFRTWRNTITEQAASELAELFRFNVPQRWSIAHLDQAILNGEGHVKHLHYLTTLAGYVHWKLTDQKVLGIGDASGMFPIDSKTCQFDQTMLERYDQRIAPYDLGWEVEDVLPTVLRAGEFAGALTPAGAALLDPTGILRPGIPMAAPEGDAGTGMCATNSVAEGTGNTSAGTSVFSMVVLQKPLSKVYPEIDMVTTPAGKPVAMVHCNNCTSDINAWVALLKEFGQLFGLHASDDEIFTALFRKALEAPPDCSGLLSYNYYSGEPVTGLAEGRPLFVRKPDAKLSLANFMQAQAMSAIASLKIGLDILKKEQVQITSMYGHGGYFKTPGVGQSFLAAAIQAPVYVLSTAGEGGPWGMALLASFLIHRAESETLEEFLAKSVFSAAQGSCVEPNEESVRSFNSYMTAYRKGLAIEQAAVDCF